MNIPLQFLRRCIECRAVYSGESCLAVCLSVHLSNACIVTKWKKDLSTFTDYMKVLAQFFFSKRTVRGSDLYYLKFCVNRASVSEIADFECRRGLAMSVRLSVKRVDCGKTEERSVQIFIPYERSFSLVF